MCLSHQSESLVPDPDSNNSQSHHETSQRPRLPRPLHLKNLRPEHNLSTKALTYFTQRNNYLICPTSLQTPRPHNPPRSIHHATCSAIYNWAHSFTSSRLKTRRILSLPETTHRSPNSHFNLRIYEHGWSCHITQAQTVHYACKPRLLPQTLPTRLSDRVVHRGSVAHRGSYSPEPRPCSPLKIYGSIPPDAKLSFSEVYLELSLTKTESNGSGHEYLWMKREKLLHVLHGLVRQVR